MKTCIDDSEFFTEGRDIYPHGGRYSPPSGFIFASISDGNLLTEPREDSSAIWSQRYVKPSALVLQAYEDAIRGLNFRPELRGIFVQVAGDRYIIQMQIGEFYWRVPLAIIEKLSVLKHEKRKQGGRP